MSRSKICSKQLLDGTTPNIREYEFFRKSYACICMYNRPISDFHITFVLFPLWHSPRCLSIIFIDILNLIIDQWSINLTLNWVYISTTSKVISDLVYCAKPREITLDSIFALYLRNDCVFTCEFWHMPSLSCEPSFSIIVKGQKSLSHNLELTEHKNDLVVDNFTPLIRPWQAEASSLTG